MIASEGKAGSMTAWQKAWSRRRLPVCVREDMEQHERKISKSCPNVSLQSSIFQGGTLMDAVGHNVASEGGQRLHECDAGTALREMMK